MVSLFTQFVAGGAVEVPVVDPRLATHSDSPVVDTSDEGPAAGDAIASTPDGIPSPATDT
jgi:hypothetical protein